MLALKFSILVNILLACFVYCIKVENLNGWEKHIIRQQPYYDFVVKIFYKSTYICNGCIVGNIKKQFVLTVASCIFNFHKNHLHITMVNDVKKSIVKRDEINIKNVTYHPGYVHGKMHDNIALLTLLEGTNETRKCTSWREVGTSVPYFTKIHIVCWTENFCNGLNETCQYLGYFESEFLSQNDCEFHKDIVNNNLNIFDKHHMFCASRDDENEFNLTLKDNGCPVIERFSGAIIGIVAPRDSNSTLTTERLNIFTDLTSYLPFLLNYMKIGFL